MFQVSFSFLDDIVVAEDGIGSETDKKFKIRKIK